MEGQVYVPVVSETAGKTNCSSSASSETPRQGLGRTFPSPPRPRPGSSRILVVFASTAPLASRPIHVSASGHTYYDSHDGQGTTTGAMGRRSNRPFYHPLLTVQGLPFPVDIRSVLFLPEPGTTRTAETPVPYPGHLRGLGKAGLDAISYSTR